jgi:class 3 adenylate cyclase
MSEITRRTFEQPDEIRTFPRMVGQLIAIGSVAVGRAILEPGWRFSTDLGPATGNPSCQVHHVQLVLAGRMGFRMDSGEEAEVGPGDVVDVPRGHDAWVIGDEPAVVVDLYGNVNDVGMPTERQRVVTTILMSDIVESTTTARQLGDAAWRQLLADHDRIVRARLDRFAGREVNTTGDGFVATFPSAIGALRAAAAISDGVAGIGLQVRIGVHTGEVELVAEDIRGLAVHAAARIMSLAGPSEVLVSAATQGLVDGSGLTFVEHGTHELKGFDRPVQVFQLAGPA